MAFKIEKTRISGVIKIIPDVFSDERGQFIKEFEKNEYKIHGLPTEFFEMNESTSNKGTLRGLHFQKKHPQGKLVRIIRGSVYDVVVDLRKDSDTFGEWEAFYLNESNRSMLYIPPNFAHGFLTLEANTIFSYKCTDKYSPQHDSGIRWDDPTLKILWPLNLVDSIIISDKDKCLNSYEEYVEWLDSENNNDK